MKHQGGTRTWWLWGEVTIWGLLALICAACDPTPAPPPPPTSQSTVGSTQDPCLASLPTPVPNPPSHRVVQLVNCTNQILLGAANAAKQLNALNPTPVFPREQTWEMLPVGSPKNGNVLTIDIPPEWEQTICPKGAKSCVGVIGPRFWARTGCQYDIGSRKRGAVPNRIARAGEVLLPLPHQKVPCQIRSSTIRHSISLTFRRPRSLP